MCLLCNLAVAVEEGIGMAWAGVSVCLFIVGCIPYIAWTDSEKGIMIWMTSSWLKTWIPSVRPAYLFRRNVLRWGTYVLHVALCCVYCDMHG